MVDIYVQMSQAYLNSTYGGHTGWVELSEDGYTGWQTMYGLRRGLQVELGITPLASGFGPTTRGAYQAQIGRIGTRTTDTRLLMLLSCSLWCKGQPGLPDYFYEPGPGEPQVPTFEHMAGSVATLRDALGLGTTDPHVDVKMMAWLMSMDTYRLVDGGTTTIQDVQRWVNLTYAEQAALDLVATNGLFTRSMQIALMIATQLELGMSAEEATGTFGEQTRGRLRRDPEIPNSDYRGEYFNHLFQAWLTVNGYPLVVDGIIGSATQGAAVEFQEFMAILDADFMSAGTWMALMVSCGDPDRPVAGFDYALQLSAGAYQAAWDDNYRIVGRYLSGVTYRDGVPHDKFLDIEEINALKADPVKVIDIFPIYQILENDLSYISYDDGYTLGLLATQRAHVLGLPANSIVYFAIDFDAYGTTITGPVLDHFRGINDAVSSVSSTYPMRVGIYGARNVCDVVVTQGLATASFVAGATYGWSANMGYPMPRSWHYNQIQETHIDLGGTSYLIDKVAVSPNCEPVRLQWVEPPPAEEDGRASATGFDLDFDWFVRALHAVEREFATQDDVFGEYRPDADNYLMQAMAHVRYSSPPWQVFTPYGRAIVVDAAVQALDELGFRDFDGLRDARHFAVATRAHELRGVMPPSGYAWSLGDLGGWGLDLYSLWVRHAYDGGTISSPSTVYDFVAANIGSSESLFGRPDIVADADAFLVAEERSSGESYQDILRRVLSGSIEDRIRRFYQHRFGGIASVVVDATVGLSTGADNGDVADAFGVAYNYVCQDQVGIDPPDLTLPGPTLGQAQAVGQAFADYLDGLS